MKIYYVEHKIDPCNRFSILFHLWVLRNSLMQACNQVQGWKPMSLDSFLDTRFSKDWSDHQLESHQSHLHHSQPGTIGSYENSKVQTNLKSASAAFLRPRPRPRPLPRPLGAPAASPPGDFCKFISESIEKYDKKHGTTWNRSESQRALKRTI